VRRLWLVGGHAGSLGRHSGGGQERALRVTWRGNMSDPHAAGKHPARVVGGAELVDEATQTLAGGPRDPAGVRGPREAGHRAPRAEPSCVTPVAGSLVGGRFEIEGDVGSGGMGIVFRALDRVSGQRVALKILRRPGGEHRARFAREAQLLSEIRHPGIVRYLAHGTSEDGAPYLAMEWLEGEDLRSRLSGGPLSLADSVAVVAGAAGALGAVHARGVVHRDVTPRNLWLSGGAVDRVRILDFGIARVDHTEHPTVTGVALGTPSYMSPEQARGAADVDARTDVFALGAILFECLTGRAAFAGESPLAVITKVLIGDVPPVRSARPEVPEALGAVVAAMLSKEPAGRPRDGEAVARALLEIGPLHPLRLDATVAVGTSLTGAEQQTFCLVLAASTASTEALDPERAAELRRVLGPFGARAQVTKDGSIVVTFAAQPVATDLARRAARCALALRARLPGVGIAVATGRGVPADPIDVGALVDRAGALLHAAPDAACSGGDAPAIRLDEVTARLVATRFDVAGEAGALTLLGERSPVDASRTLLGKRPPFVGREHELGSLLAAFDRCVAEPAAQAIVVKAPAGMGKSRLREELLRRLGARAPALEVWMSAGDPLRAGSPYGMIGPVIRRLAGIVDGEPIEARRDKLVARVGRRIASASSRTIAELLGEVAGVPFPDDESAQLRAARADPGLMGDQARRAFEAFVASECGACPVVLVLEDLHWGDRPSVQFVDAALRGVREAPFLVLALARPDVDTLFPGLWAERGTQELRLGELSRRAGERLVREVLGDAATPELSARLVERAAGNAFFLEELIRAAAAGESDHLPETVVAMAQARLDALEPDARRILRAASVLGEGFCCPGILAVLGGTCGRAEIEAWLDVLVDREVLVRRAESRFPGERELAFHHALLCEVAYATLTDADRAPCHARAAEWLLGAGEDDPLVLAGHLERGGEPGAAVEQYRRAAAAALDAGDGAAAQARARRGIACGASGEDLGALLLIEGEACAWRGAFDALDRGLEALRLLRRGSVLWYRAIGHTIYASARVSSGELCAGLVADLCSASPEPSAWRARVCALAGAARACFLYVDDPSLAHRLFAEMEAAPAELVASDPATAGLVWRARAFQARRAGDLTRLFRCAEAAASSFELAGNVRATCSCRCDLSYAYVELGAHVEAERQLRCAVAASGAMGLSQPPIGVEHALGLVLLYVGRLDEATALSTRVAGQLEGRGEPLREGATRMNLAMIHLAAGRLAEGAAEARRAVALLATFSAFRPMALAVLANVLVARGEAHAALEVAREAIAGVSAVQVQGPFVRLSHAEALIATGDHLGAEQAIREAYALLLEDAAKIGDPRWRERFLRDVPENARIVALAGGAHRAQ
jgi:hypothetical protein